MRARGARMRSRVPMIARPSDPPDPFDKVCRKIPITGRKRAKEQKPQQGEAPELPGERGARTKNRPRWQVLTVRGCRFGRRFRRPLARIPSYLVTALSRCAALTQAPGTPGQTTSNRQKLPARAVFRARTFFAKAAQDAHAQGRRRGEKAGRDQRRFATSCAIRGTACLSPCR